MPQETLDVFFLSHQLLYIPKTPSETVVTQLGAFVAEEKLSKVWYTHTPCEPRLAPRVLRPAGAKSKLSTPSVQYSFDPKSLCRETRRTPL